MKPTSQEARQIIEDMDFELMQMEDYLHGSDGEKITALRKKLAAYLTCFDTPTAGDKPSEVIVGVQCPSCSLNFAHHVNLDFLNTPAPQNAAGDEITAITIVDLVLEKVVNKGVGFIGAHDIREEMKVWLRDKKLLSNAAGDNWISVESGELPEQYTPLYVFGIKEGYTSGSVEEAYFASGDFRIPNNGSLIKGITHWQYAPKDTLSSFSRSRTG